MFTVAVLFCCAAHDLVYVHLLCSLICVACILSLQDAIDVFLGNYVVEETEGLSMTSALSSQRGWKFFAVCSLSIKLFSIDFFIVSQSKILDCH